MTTLNSIDIINDKSIDKSIDNTIISNIINKYDTNYKFEDNEINSIKTIYNNNKDLISIIISDGFGDEYINYPIWISFITKMIEIIEKYKNLTGIQKKNILIFLCICIIEIDTNINDDLKKTFVSIIKTVLPDIIDSIVNLSKKINIVFKKFAFCKFFCKFFNCCFKK